MISALEIINLFSALGCSGNHPDDPAGGYPGQRSATMPDGLALPSMTHHVACGGSVDLAGRRQVYYRGWTK